MGETGLQGLKVWTLCRRQRKLKTLERFENFTRSLVFSSFVWLLLRARFFFFFCFLVLAFYFFVGVAFWGRREGLAKVSKLGFDRNCARQSTLRSVTEFSLFVAVTSRRSASSSSSALSSSSLSPFVFFFPFRKCGGSKTKNKDSMSGWDQGQVYASNQGLVVGENGKKDVLLNDPAMARATFREFIRCHREGNVFRYRDQLLLNFRKRQYALEVDLEDLNNFDSALKDVLQESPSVFLPIFEEAAADVIRRIGLQQVR